MALEISYSPLFLENLEAILKFFDERNGSDNFKSLDEYGFLGVKFFDIPTIFDFSDKKLYLCKYY